MPSELFNKVHYLTGMLIFGTCTSITMKMQLEMECDGYHHHHTFDKPFFQSIAMFLAMAAVLPLSYVLQPKQKPKEGEEKPLMSVNAANDSKKESSPLVVILPCTFDLIASTVMTFGLIYISVSVFQMLRGSMIIFSAIFSRIFFHRRVPMYQICAIFLCVVALGLVSIAGMMIPQANMAVTTGQYIMGIALVIISQIIQAGQIVIEEHFLRNLNMPPLRVVGYEGLWGLLLMIFVACPLAYLIPGFDYSTMPHNSLENTYDSFLCMSTQPLVVVIVLVFMVAVLFYNCYGMLITNSFSAVHRTLFEAVRTSCIWITDLVIHAIWPDSVFGEVWTNWSFLELGGFALLIFSTMMYNANIKIPFFSYDEPAKQTEQAN